jgi:hypothetical protein
VCVLYQELSGNETGLASINQQLGSDLFSPELFAQNRHRTYSGAYSWDDEPAFRIFSSGVI